MSIYKYKRQVSPIHFTNLVGESEYCRRLNYQKLFKIFNFKLLEYRGGRNIGLFRVSTNVLNLNDFILLRLFKFELFNFKLFHHQGGRNIGLFRVSTNIGPGETVIFRLQSSYIKCVHQIFNSWSFISFVIIIYLFGQHDHDLKYL